MVIFRLSSFYASKNTSGFLFSGKMQRREAINNLQKLYATPTSQKKAIETIAGGDMGGFDGQTSADKWQTF